MAARSSILQFHYRLLKLVLANMSISFGKLKIRVPEKILDQIEVGVSLDKPACERMPKAVKIDPSFLVHYALVEQFTNHIIVNMGYHGVGFVFFPSGRKYKLIRSARATPGKHLFDIRGHVCRSVFAAFGVSQHDDSLEGINVCPFEACNLSESHAGIEREHRHIVNLTGPLAKFQEEQLGFNA